MDRSYVPFTVHRLGERRVACFLGWDRVLSHSSVPLGQSLSCPIPENSKPISGTSMTVWTGQGHEWDRDLCPMVQVLSPWDKWATIISVPTGPIVGQLVRPNAIFNLGLGRTNCPTTRPIGTGLGQGWDKSCPNFPDFCVPVPDLGDRSRN